MWDGCVLLLSCCARRVGASALDLGGLPVCDGCWRAKSCVANSSATAKETVYGCTEGNSTRSVGQALRGRGPQALGLKLRGTNAGGSWICGRAAELEVVEDKE